MTSIFLKKSKLALTPKNLKKLKEKEYSYGLTLMVHARVTFEDMLVYTTLFLLSMKNVEVEMYKDDLYEFIESNKDILVPLTKSEIKKVNATT